MLWQGGPTSFFWFPSDPKWPEQAPVNPDNLSRDRYLENNTLNNKFNYQNSLVLVVATWDHLGTKKKKKRLVPLARALGYT